MSDFEPPPRPLQDKPFRSFWMGGYEGADHLNGFATPLDMARGNGHVDQLEADHDRAAELGIRTVRETIGWRLAETGPGRFDLTRALRIARSANRCGLQVLWTLMHYGTPADVSLLDDTAIDRFARFAATVAATLGPMTDTPPVYNPVNEISFLAWAVSQTDMLHPYRNDPGNNAPSEGIGGSAASGYEVKRRLVRMALHGMDAMRQVDPRARFLHVEPLVHVAPPRDRPELAELADRIAGYQWQAWDLLSGRVEPELGGEARALDLLGINHYHSSQWEAATEDRLWWHLRDARRQPFGALLEAAWTRYRRPMIVAETSHFGEGRPQWLNELASEVERVRGLHVPVEGICLYPLIDRTDWSNPAQWHHSGLWDVDAREVDARGVDAREVDARGVDTQGVDTQGVDAQDGADRPGDPRSGEARAQASPPHRRVLCTDYAAALARWQTRLPEPLRPTDPKPTLLVFSHLRWSFVHHRPQQLLSRLSRDFHICYVEEPLPLGQPDGTPRLDCVSHGPGIDVLLLRTPLDDPSFSEPQRATLAPLLAAFLSARGVGRGVDPCIAWFYTPMALPLLDLLAPRPGVDRFDADRFARDSIVIDLVVYDCIDEMTAFANAPAGLAAREASLLRTADLVLTSGPALQRSKAASAIDFGREIRCVPNGVDAGHFSPLALDPGAAQAAQALQRQGPSAAPRFGYCGVIDERIDMDLLETLALAHPDWQFIMAGPVLKVDPLRLPTAQNIRWLGHQPYVRLPHLIASWDVCLLPFAITRLTRVANPTKVLEYLAAAKQVVSTPLPDVVALYGNAVRVATSGTAFLEACEEALHESAAARAMRLATAGDIVARSSWDDRAETIAAWLHASLAEAGSGREHVLPTLPLRPTDVASARP